MLSGLSKICSGASRRPSRWLCVGPSTYKTALNQSSLPDASTIERSANNQLTASVTALASVWTRPRPVRERPVGSGGLPPSYSWLRQM